MPIVNGKCNFAACANYFTVCVVHAFHSFKRCVACARKSIVITVLKGSIIIHVTYIRMWLIVLMFMN